MFPHLRDCMTGGRNQMKFSIDNPFFYFMSRLADLVVLNLLFILTSLPVFTIGTSLTAMYEVLRKMREGTEGTLYRTYFGIFIAEFKRTVKSWLAMLGIGALLFGDLYISVTMIESSKVRPLLLILGSMTFLYLMAESRMYLDLPEEERSVKEDIRTAFYKAVRQFPQTLLMIVLEMVPFLVYLFSFRYFAAFMLPVMLVIWFSLRGLICVILSEGAARTENGKEKNIGNDYL